MIFLLLLTLLGSSVGSGITNLSQLIDSQDNLLDGLFRRQDEVDRIFSIILSELPGAVPHSTVKHRDGSVVQKMRAKIASKVQSQSVTTSEAPPSDDPICTSMDDLKELLLKELTDLMRRPIALLSFKTYLVTARDAIKDAALALSLIRHAHAIANFLRQRTVAASKLSDCVSHIAELSRRKREKIQAHISLYKVDSDRELTSQSSLVDDFASAAREIIRQAKVVEENAMKSEQEMQSILDSFELISRDEFYPDFSDAVVVPRDEVEEIFRAMTHPGKPDCESSDGTQEFDFCGEDS